ncbi:hypothetical protein [Prescottella equi]|uniref:hypothetical protein n=1 Tax=Rhodococcus hoagii TaxID=43767 RepID=UPI001E44265A|nr:hypothetical protein [Prescottella equi]
MAFDAADDAHEHCYTTYRREEADRQLLSQGERDDRPLHWLLQLIRRSHSTPLRQPADCRAGVSDGVHARTNRVADVTAVLVEGIDRPRREQSCAHTDDRSHRRPQSRHSGSDQRSGRGTGRERRPEPSGPRNYRLFDRFTVVDVVRDARRAESTSDLETDSARA